jgi:hercynine metabolism protein
MSAAADWFSELEQQLEAQLNAFLQANPAQEQLLHQQEQQERRQRLKRRQLELQASAEQVRSELLALVQDIAQWQERVERARAAGATELAQRADLHLGALMARGRDRWQALGELGTAFRRLEQELIDLPRAEARPAAGTESLDQAWAAFEADQDLDVLRRQKKTQL